MKKLLSIALSALLAVGAVSAQSVAAHAATVAPNAPSQVSGLGGDGYISARVFIDTAGDPATSVTVTATPGGASCTITMPAISCDLTGLTNGTGYSLSGVATNSAGQSSATVSGWSITPTAAPSFTAVDNDCPGAAWVIQPCYAADFPTTITVHGSNLQSCTQVTGFGGGYYTPIPVVVNPAGTTLSFVHPGDPSAYGWMSLNCLTQNAFMMNAIYPVGKYYSGTPSWSSSSGYLSGGNTVTLTTSYYTFAGVTAVTLGGKAVTYTVIDATHMQIVIPAGDALGSVDLSVTNVDGVGTIASAYTYVPDPAPAAPGDPGKATAVAGVGQATVTVVPPTTGGTPVSYTVTSSPDGQTCTITVPDTSCTVTGLTPGVSYTFSITATNVGGTSNFSVASDPVVPTGVTTYAVTYDGNGATAGSAPTDSTAYAGGDTAWVDGYNTLERPGYRLDGWNTAANGSGLPYYPEQSFTITGDATLYAQWIKVYGVTYDANGATSGTAPQDSNTYDTGTSATVKANSDLAKTGYVFAGWNTATDGSGAAYGYHDQVTLNGDVTLYAQWDKAVVSSLGKSAHVHRFKSHSAKLRPGMRTQINKFLRAVPRGSAIVCEGHTGGKVVTKQLTKLAKARAASVCAYAQHVRSDIKVTLVAKPATPKGHSARNTWLIWQPVIMP